MEMNEMNYEIPEVNNSEVETPVEPEKKSAALSITSMIIGIASFVLSCCGGYFTIFTSIAAVVLAIIAFAKQSGKKGMAIVGLICGILGFILSIIFIVVGAVALSDLGSYSY
jgi:hypothetical protein